MPSSQDFREALFEVVLGHPQASTWDQMRGTAVLAVSTESGLTSLGVPVTPSHPQNPPASVPTSSTRVIVMEYGISVKSVCTENGQTYRLIKDSG